MKKTLRQMKIVLQAIHEQPEMANFVYPVLSGIGIGLTAMSGWIAYYKKETELFEYKSTVVPYNYETMLIVPDPGNLIGARENGKVFRYWIGESDGYQTHFYVTTPKSEYEIGREEATNAHFNEEDENAS